VAKRLMRHVVPGPVLTMFDVRFSVPVDLGYSCCDSKVATRPLVYPTCSAGSSGDVSVARFANLETNEGDVSPGMPDDGDGVLIVCFAVFDHEGANLCQQRDGLPAVVLENDRVGYTLASDLP
jgi:hypothetical protein